MATQMGRPKSPDPRTKLVTVRLTEDEHAAVWAAAKSTGKGIGPWMRERIVAAAKRAQR